MSIFDKLLPKRRKNQDTSFLNKIVTGSLYKVSDVREDSAYRSIKNQIECDRALAQDSQVATALSFYSTDATLANSKGQIIWATATDDKYKDAADIINACFDRWTIGAYARDHILELATVGNLYIPTSRLYNDYGSGVTRVQVGLDSNTLKDEHFDIIPSYKLLPEETVHLWYQGEPQGFIYQPDNDLVDRPEILLLPESSIIHFSLGGLLGDYKLDAVTNEGEEIQYDIQFAKSLMQDALQPTQTLSLMEDSLLLASLVRVVKFINVDCGNKTDENEIRRVINDIKDTIEQQLSLDTVTGDMQSFVNPQSPNNLIYIPKVNGQDAISITDLNMVDATEADSKLLDHFQNKKLSVLGVPKEAMNYSSNEGLGGAGSVLSQRSALYANALERLKNAYMRGWTQAFNKYFTEKGYKGFVNNFQLHMQPIITQQSTISFERRDSAISQAAAIVDLMVNLGVDNADKYKEVLVEILTEALPATGGSVQEWNIDPVTEGEENDY